MTYALYSVPAEKRTELDAALKDDVVSRQSQTIRDAAAMGGPSGRTYVLVEGSPEGVRRAEELLKPLGTQLPPGEATALYEKFRDERESASAGMGLFFTED